MSFCRITGKSRSLPKPNYFPIIPPISPDDAKRFCKITGKSYGLPSHHFIPVRLASFGTRKKCRVTNMAPVLGRHHYVPDILYGKRKHIVLLDYRYVVPKFDINDEGHKELFKIFSEKFIENSDGHFVYRVDEKQCNLVLPAKLEEAIRDGDVCDIMFAKDTDQILLRLKNGQNISLDISEFQQNLDDLFEGEGPKEEVLLERERELEQEKKTKKISKRRQQLKSITKIFEDKELANGGGDDDEQDEMKKKSLKKKAKMMKNVPKCVNKKEVQKVKKLLEKIAEDSSKSYQDLIKPMLESWDWDTYEWEAKNAKTSKSTKPVMTKKMKPLVVSPAKVKVKSRIKDFEKKLLLDNTIGFECIPFVGQYKKPDLKALVQNFSQLQTATPEMMKKLENVVEKFQKAPYEISSLLPSEDEIFEVLQNITKGHKSELNGVPGIQIDIEDRRVFLAGEFIINEKGEEVFIPGQAVINEKGKRVFVPGLTTFDPSNSDSYGSGISFIAGQVMKSKDKECQMHFQAGQIIDDEFVCGQTIYVNDKPEFIEGQTILTPEGFRFVAGLYDENNMLVPGKVMKVPNPNGIGEMVEKFIAGQMTETFMAGQNVQVGENEWVFACGQTVVDENGVESFCSGKTIQTKEGSKFVSGQFDDNGTFIPGVVKKVGNHFEFVPGISIETKQGMQFVEGQLVDTEEHGQIFMPGRTQYKPSGLAEFNVADSIDEINFHAPPPTGLVIDSHSLEVSEPTLTVFGNMVQTEYGIEFYPEKIGEDNLPEGKMIPGKLIKSGNETKFVPGIVGENGFIPGQVVKNLSTGVEEFVPGQLVESSAAGLKFVPGQVITLKNGDQKFIPGVTDKNGRFIPGQIIETRAGPTFIPGQICYTEEEGERFVPGQIIDGCFVPGRIVETDDKVTFIAGQLVETPEGPRFIHPDIKGKGEDFEFNLQGFSVTPEELELIKPQHNWACSLGNSGELAIDNAMMKQLTAAGMSIGRQVESGQVDIVLQSTLNREIVEKFCDTHEGISIDIAESIFKMIKQLTDEHRENIGSGNMTAKILELCMSMNLPINMHNFEASQTANLDNNEKSEKTEKGKKKKKSVRHQTVIEENAATSETNQIVNILTKVMLEILKSDEANSIIDHDGSLIQHGKSSDSTNAQVNINKNKVESVYEIIANVLNEQLQHLKPQQLQNTFTSPNIKELVLEKLNTTMNKVETLCKIEEMKQNLLNSAFGLVSDIQNGHATINGVNKKTVNNSGRPNVPMMPAIMVNDNDVVVEQFCDIIDDLDVASAFSAMTKNNPQLMLNVLNAISNSSDIGNQNVLMKDLIQKAIVEAVQKESSHKLEQILQTSEVSQIENLLNESLILAKALGMTKEAMQILNALDKTLATGRPQEIVLDEAAKSVVQRMCIMKQLAEIDPDYQDAIEMLQQSPHRAVKDEIVRELVRKSGLISIQANIEEQNQKIESSNDIPPALMNEENILAMEDFMLRNGSGSKAFLIIKDGVQCVVPREKSHDVLTGKCAYTVLDENGIRHFEPLHVMNALRLNTPTQHHRFSIYANDAALAEISKMRRSSCSPTYDTQARDFQFSACDFVENLDNSSSDNGETSENGNETNEFGEFFAEGVNYDVDKETGYRRPRRRRYADKEDPTSNLDFQTTLMLNKRRGARPDRVSKSPITTQVYRQYTQVNDNIYIMHAYVYHSGKKDKNATAAR